MRQKRFMSGIFRKYCEGKCENARTIGELTYSLIVGSVVVAVIVGVCARQCY